MTVMYKVIEVSQTKHDNLVKETKRKQKVKLCEQKL